MSCGGHLAGSEGNGICVKGLHRLGIVQALQHDLHQLLPGVRLERDPPAAPAGHTIAGTIQRSAPVAVQQACMSCMQAHMHRSTCRMSCTGSPQVACLLPRREAMRGRRRSGKSSVLATPMTASLAPGRMGHSNRLYSTCTQGTSLAEWESSNGAVVSHLGLRLLRSGAAAAALGLAGLQPSAQASC